MRRRRAGRSSMVARARAGLRLARCMRFARRLCGAGAITIGALTAGAGCFGAAEPFVPVVPVAPEFTAFSLERARNPALPADVAGVIAGDTIRFVIPAIVDVDSLVPTFTTNESLTIVAIGTAVQRSGTSTADLTTDIRYTLTSSTGDIRSYVVTVTVFTGLPAILITTDGGAAITSRDTYVPATVRVYGGKDHPEWSFTAPTGIRGRGNSTWFNPKKPYRLKLTTSASMFGFPADRDWALLANYWDLTLARNALAFKLSSLLGMAFTPRCMPYEMFLNGEHQGSYQLCDHMQVAASRVPAGSDGWFLELVDQGRADADGDEYFHTPRIDEYSTRYDPTASVWSYKQPDPPSVAQRALVEGQVRTFERVLYGPTFADPDTGYAAHVDVRSVIDWYLVNELSKNNDSAFSFSVYIFRSATGKITFGPVWDFDLAFGNYPYDGGPTGWKIKDSGWLERFFADPAFVAQLKERWQFLRGRRAEIDAFLVDYTAPLLLSQRRSHAMWHPYLPLPGLRAEESAAAFGAPLRQSFAALFSDSDYAAEVLKTRTWLSTRFDWLDGRIAGL